MDKERIEENRRAIDLAVSAADKFENCDYIVFHPGDITGPKCCLQNLYDLMRGTDDERIILEVVPVFGYPERYSFPVHRVADWKGFKEETGKDILLDIGHAAITARAMNYDPVVYMNELINEFGITIVHAADNNAMGDGYNDSHMHIGSGDVPIEEISKQNKSRIKYATIEVGGVSSDDVALVRKYIA